MSSHHFSDSVFAQYIDWSDGDTLFMNVDIDGNEVVIKGTPNGGNWSFEFNEPSAVPVGITISNYASGSDLGFAIVNGTGDELMVTFLNAYSTTQNRGGTWEMAVFPQLDASATSSFPYTREC